MRRRCATVREIRGTDTDWNFASDSAFLASKPSRERIFAARLAPTHTPLPFGTSGNHLLHPKRRCVWQTPEMADTCFTPTAYGCPVTRCRGCVAVLLRFSRSVKEEFHAPPTPVFLLPVSQTVAEWQSMEFLSPFTIVSRSLFAWFFAGIHSVPAPKTAFGKKSQPVVSERLWCKESE